MMYLYDKHTTDFSRNGEPIRHAYDAHVERDEGFQLNFKLRLDEAESYKQIQPEMIISAMTPDGVNYFRVWEPVKHDTYVEVIALQLMYDLDNKLVKPFKATNATGALVLNAYMSSFLSSYTPFTISSLVDERHDFTLDEDVESYNALEVLQRIANRWDSELSVVGFDIRLIKRHGKRTNVLIHENKNISEFVDKTTIEGMATRIHARSTFRATEDAEEDTVIDVTVDSPLIDEYSQIYEKFYVNNDAKSIQELTNWVNLKYSTDNLDKPIRTFEVGTHIIDDTEINYGDDLVLKYHSHDVDEVIRCVGYDYDPISATYLGITLGSFRQSFTDAVNGRVSDGFNQAINKVTKEVQLVTATANGLNRETWGELPIPNPRKGDKWFYFTSDRPNEVELRMWDGEKWVVIVDDYTGERIKQNVQDAMDTALEAKEDAVKSKEDAIAHADSIVQAQNAEWAEWQEDNLEAIQGAIDKAEEAKADAQQAYVDAVADTDAKIAVKDQEWLAWEQTYDDTVEALVDSIDEADGKAQSAISVSDTAKTIAEGADAKASTAIGTANSASATANQAVGAANEAVSKANTAIAQSESADSKATNAITDAQTAISNASNALITANEVKTEVDKVPDKINDTIVERGLINGTQVDEKINLINGEFSLAISDVKGQIPLYVMGFTWDKDSDPTLKHTDYLQDYVELEEYQLLTADYELTKSGWSSRLSSLETNKLDAEVFTSFKTNEFNLTVEGLDGRITNAEDNKLDGETFNTFKSNDYDVTVDGFSTSIQSLEDNKLDSTSFESFKTNEFNVKIDGLDGRISNKLSTDEFIKFKTNDYEVTVDGFRGNLDYINGATPTIVMGFDWDKEESPQLIRTGYAQDTLDTLEFERFTADYELTVSQMSAEFIRLDNNKVGSEYVTGAIQASADELLIEMGKVENKIPSLDGYATQTWTNTQISTSASGLQTQIASKLDTNTFSEFKTNEFDVTVQGFGSDIQELKTDKLDGSTFNSFKTNEFDVTVDGLSTDIQTLQTDKLDENTFNQFKQNDFDVTVDGLFMNITDIQGAIPKTVMGIAWDKTENPTLRRTDFTEDIMNLDDFELFNASYEFTKTGFTTDISNLRRDKLDGSEFSSFKEHTFDVTVAGLDGRISSKLDTSEFTTFKTNDYDVTVDGFKSDIQAVNQKIPNYILGVEWDKSPDSSLVRTDYTTDTASINFVNNLVEETADSFSRTIVEVQGEFQTFVAGVEWDKESDPTLERTGIARDNAKAFSQLKQTQDGIYALVGDNKESLASAVMTSNAWSTEISGANGLATKVAQLNNSYAINITSAGKLKTEINATTDGIRLKGKVIHLDGDTLIDNALIKSAHIDTLNASKIYGTSADFNAIRTGVLTADAVKSTHIESSTAVIDKLFATTALINQLTSKTAFINKIKAIDIDASRITTGTINANKISGTSADFATIRSGVLQANVVTSAHISADNALIDKLFATDALIDRLTSKTGFIADIQAINISADKITTGTLNATNVNIINLDVNSLTGNKSTFLQSLWQSTNSQSSIDGNRIRIDNTNGDFIEMNNIPEIRTDDADGTATVMGKGRVHFYDKRGHSKGYMGTDMHTANANDFGIWLSKGSGTFSFARMADATQVNYLYYTVKSGMNWRVAVLEDMVRMGLIPDGNAQQFVANSNNIAQLNGWPTLPQDWPNLTVGQQIRYKEIPGQVTGEAYHKMIQVGPSSGSDWRAYFNIQARFNAGFTDASDRRLKRDIEDSAIDALGHINNLEFKEFTMKSDDRYEPIGLIAQEAGILRVADDEMEGINIPRAIMLALKGIQELNRKVGELGKPSTTKHNQ